jgi:hypothetical protein
VAGKGVIRHLILDRGFIDGAAIGRAKIEHGMDATIGVRRNMNIYADAAWALMTTGENPDARSVTDRCDLRTTIEERDGCDVFR